MYLNRKLRVSRKGKGVELLAENSVGAGAGIAQRSRLKQEVKGGGTASDSNGTEGKVRRVYLGCQVEPKRRGGGGSRHVECEMRGRRRDSDYFGLIRERGALKARNT